MRKLCSVPLFLVLLASASVARQDWVVCGSHPERWKDEIHLHHRAALQRRVLRGGVTRAAREGPSRAAAAQDIGEIAVVEDSDGVVARRNEFNLDGQTLTFVPSDASATRYRFRTGNGNYDMAAAASGTRLTGLADDDTRGLALPFSFPFFGVIYTHVFVNSDGNLTFGRSDVNTAERSLGRVTAGPPRIAGLFRDLDPSQSRDGVRVLSEPSRFVVSWSGVPEYQALGAGTLETFQIRIFPNGRIEFAYAGVDTRSAVVGIAPGELQGSSSVVSFASGSAQEFPAAIVERFTSDEEIDIVVAAQKFYETHEDAYDYLVLFNTLGIPASSGAIAFEVTVRNDRAGFGDQPVNIGREFGSAKRMQAIMNMGPLSQYPRSPNAVMPARGPAGDTPLTILGHEAGHLFLAYASIRDPADPGARPMLGRQGAHWSFTFNSEASFLEGNRIRDDGENASPRFTTVATVEQYAPLDQYLMGFRPPEEVSPTFLVTEASVGPSNRMPQAGVSFNGRRRDVRVDEIIAAEGRRIPDYTVAQRRFRFAFILVVAQGTQPSQEQIAQLDTYRREFEPFYHRASGARAWAETSLRRSLRLSTFPASGVLQGSSATATVTLQSAAQTPLTVLLSSQSGAISVPSSVTIPPGMLQAAFTIRGMRSGVDELTAEIPGELYEQATSKVQVTASASSLHFVTISGDKQVATAGTPLPEPVVLRVLDSNNLPYPGVRVNADVSPGGLVDPTVATTDESGAIHFHWTPGTGPLNEMRVSLQDSTPPTAVTVTALGRPSFAIGGLVNAASFSPSISPGSLATLFGANLAAGVTESAGSSVTDRLASVQVLLNGTAALITFVSDTQINFVVPPNLSPGEGQMVVSTPLGASDPVRVTVAALSPGIFVQSPTGLGAVVLAGTGQTTAERPAAPGDVLEIYATGLGPVRESSIPGLQETLARPEILLGSVPTELLFSGQSPCCAGLYQVNVRVPDQAQSGLQPLRLTIGGVTANVVQIRLR
jgi:uncharacterized protein (TIGR03437 family)